MKFLANLFGSQSADAKTLEQSRAQLAAAKASAEAVAALFTSAGLDLDALIAAGSDSLKAHLASLSAKDGELAAAQAKVTELEGKITAANAQQTTTAAQLSSTVSLLTDIGFVPVATSTGTDAKAAFEAHVKKAAALELAKTGHAPIGEVTAEQAAAPGNKASRDDHYKFLATLPVEKQSEYFQANLAQKTPDARYGLTSTSK